MSGIGRGREWRGRRLCCKNKVEGGGGDLKMGGNLGHNDDYERTQHLTWLCSRGLPNATRVLVYAMVCVSSDLQPTIAEYYQKKWQMACWAKVAMTRERWPRGRFKGA